MHLTQPSAGLPLLEEPHSILTIMTFRTRRML